MVRALNEAYTDPDLQPLMRELEGESGRVLFRAPASPGEARRESIFAMIDAILIFVFRIPLLGAGLEKLSSHLYRATYDDVCLSVEDVVATPWALLRARALDPPSNAREYRILRRRYGVAEVFVLGRGEDAPSVPCPAVDGGEDLRLN